MSTCGFTRNCTYSCNTFTNWFSTFAKATVDRQGSRRKVTKKDTHSSVFLLKNHPRLKRTKEKKSRSSYKYSCRIIFYSKRQT